eukprot:Skav216165  [mRNA]  locus=scaffold1043:15331:15534:+ [translate_table: standard]
MATNAMHAAPRWMHRAPPSCWSPAIAPGGSSTKQRYKNPARVKANLWTMRTLKGRLADLGAMHGHAL